MNAPSIIVLILLVVGLAAPRPFLTYLVFVMMPFCAMAVLPPELLGGTSLTPGTVAAFFFVLRAMVRPSVFKGTFRALINFRRLGWLGCFFAIAAAGAFVLPRIFAGNIMVFGLRTPAMGAVEPSITNFTQTFYILLSVLMASLTSFLISRDIEFRETLLKAILAGGVTLLATGLVDIVANAMGHSDLLKSFYTASYGYSSGEILGSRRVIGLTPEPAAFGGLAMCFCAMLLFLRPVYPRPLWRWKVPLVAWTCGAMAFLSASSTAYASMFVLLGLYQFYGIHAISADGSLLYKSVTRKMIWFFVILAVLPLAIFLNADLFAYVGNMIDALIINKHETSSYIERSSWTAAGLNAFKESYGLGVGVGSVRTSNFFANILASTGLPGSILFCMFIGTLYLRHAALRNSRNEAIIRAVKLTLLPIFAGMFLAGTTPDFGIIVGVLFGIIAGLAARPYENEPTAFAAIARTTTVIGETTKI